MAESIDATDVVQADIEYGSSVSSSEEMPEETSEDPIEEVVVQASVTKEERAVAYHDNVSNSVVSWLVGSIISIMWNFYVRIADKGIQLGKAVQDSSVP